MFIGNEKFPILSPQQANPALSGYQQSMQRALARQKLMQSRIQSMVQAKYAQPQAQANLQKALLGNQAQSLGMPFVAPQAQAKLQGSLLGNQATSLGNQIKQLNMPYVAPTAQANIDLKKAQANYQNMGGARSATATKNNAALINAIAQQHPELGQQDRLDWANGMQLGLKNFPDGRPFPPKTPMMQSALDQITKSDTSTAVQNQRNAAVKLRNIMTQGDKLVDGASRFAGLVGKYKGNVDKARASLGANDKDYLDYSEYTQQWTPTAVQQFMNMEGVHATDLQKLATMKIFNQIDLAHNPDMIPKQHQYLKQLEKSIDDALSQDSFGQLQSLQQPSSNNSNSSGNVTSSNSAQAPSSSNNKKTRIRYNPATGDIEEY